MTRYRFTRVQSASHEFVHNKSATRKMFIQKVMELLWKLSHYDQKYLIVVFFYSPTHEEIESWGESFDKLMQSKGIFKY